MKRYHPPRPDLERISIPWIPPGTCPFFMQGEVPEAGQSYIFPGGQRGADRVEEQVDQYFALFGVQAGGFR